MIRPHSRSIQVGRKRLPGISEGERDRSPPTKKNRLKFPDSHFPSSLPHPPNPYASLSPQPRAFSFPLTHWRISGRSFGQTQTYLLSRAQLVSVLFYFDGLANRFLSNATVGNLVEHSCYNCVRWARLGEMTPTISSFLVDDNHSLSSCCSSIGLFFYTTMLLRGYIEPNCGVCATASVASLTPVLIYFRTSKSRETPLSS